MPIAVAIPYFLAEGLAFYGVSRWIGVGWALLALFVCFLGGLLLAAVEMRRIAELSAEGRRSPGQAAGELGLLAAGAMGVALPGFITTILGLLLIIGPTRVVVRKLLARSIRTRLETFGDRMYTQAATYGQFSSRTSYGSFVIDEEDTDAPTAHSNAPDVSDEDISRWSESITPEDFDTPPEKK